MALCGLCALDGLQRGPGSARRAARRRSCKPSQKCKAWSSEDQAILSLAERAARRAGEIILAKRGADVVETKAFASDLLTEVDGECEEVIRRTVLEQHPDHGFLGEETAGSLEAQESLLASSGWVWIVDPIDGTTNFVAGQPLSAVSIGVAQDGRLRMGVIYDPFQDEMFSAGIGSGSGARCNGAPIRVSAQQATSLPLALVASGAPPNPRSARPCMRAMSILAPPRTRSVRLLGSAAINFAWVACGRLDAWFEPDLNVWDSAAGAVLVREAGGRVTDCKGAEYVLGTRPVCASNGAIHEELLGALKEADATQLDPDPDPPLGA